MKTETLKISLMSLPPLSKLWSPNSQKLKWATFVLIITAIFLANTFHEAYPDEFDNILGGKYILEGKLIYKEHFTHHGPVAYFLAALIEVFSGISFVRFRIVYSLFLLTLTFGSLHFLKKKFGDRIGFYHAFIYLLAISATFFWSHMLLADSLSAFLLVPAYLLVLLSLYHQERFHLKDLAFISLFSSLALLSSLSYAYMIGFLYLFAFYLYLKGVGIAQKKQVLKGLAVLTAPFLIFLIYLVLTNSLSDYYQQNFVFNAKYYIYNYPRPEGSGRINPVRYSIIITHNFFNDFAGALVNSKDFNLCFPFPTALALGNLGLIIYLLLFSSPWSALFILLMLTFANARSNPLTNGDTDYQAAVYIICSLANLTLFLRLTYKKLNEKVATAQKIILSFLFLFVGVYAFFLALFFQRQFNFKFFDKYMGKAPLIYDRSQIAPIINKLVSPGEFFWIGPFEFEELFYATGKIPSRYHVLLPAMGKAEEIKKTFLSDFQKNKPKVIYFDRQCFILGSNPEMYAQFFLDFLDQEYVTLSKYKRGGKQYVSAVPISEHVNLKTNLYLDKERAEAVIQDLLTQNLIKPKL
jgi:hypothetical protein